MTLEKDSSVSQYELKRQRMIEENQKLLRDLGLAEDASPNGGYSNMDFKAESPPARKKARSRSYRPAKPAQAPVRLSRRLKGEEPDDTVDLEELLDQNDKVRQAAVELSRTSAAEDDQRYRPQHISAPLTLLSIGTTIWDLGRLYTGKDRSKYWSGRGCRYRHLYPVGFKATKEHFGNTYTMYIEEGKSGEGPVFKVQVNDSKTVFTGSSPTAPWTEACKKSRSQGTRVSGPLFYGFSDIATIRMIESMENYDLASSPEESENEEE